MPRILTAAILLFATLCSTPSFGQDKPAPPEKQAKESSPAKQSSKAAADDKNKQKSPAVTQAEDVKKAKQDPAKPGAAPLKNTADEAKKADQPKKADAKKEQGKKEQGKKAEANKDASSDKPMKQAPAKDEAAKKLDPPKKENPKPKKPAKPQRKKIASIGYSDTPRLPDQPWRVHDVMRPRPAVVTPGKNSPADPPSDAIILFDGKDISNWGHRDRETPGGFIEAGWKVQDGYMEVTRGTGSIYSLDNLGSCQLHIEWASPVEVKGNGQQRGNSGIKFLGAYEVQVLDSFQNRTYADGQAGSIYGQYPPMVNAMRGPGEWQTYDIIFEIAEFDANGKLTKPAYITLFHNDVLLHHRRELSGPTGRGHARFSNHPPAGTIMLQDHGNPVRYRNIWARRLPN